jgi:hypothetical protein
MTIEKTLSEFVTRISTDTDFKKALMWNSNIFYTIQVSYQLAKKHSLEFDMRKDLWHRPDRLLFALYMKTHFNGKFSPIIEIRSHLFECKCVLEKIWNDISPKHRQLGERLWQDLPNGGWKSLCDEFASQVAKAKLTPFSKAIIEKHPAIKETGDPVKLLSHSIRDWGAGDDPEISLVTFYKRLYAMPYFISNSIESLPTSTLKVLAWDSIFGSTNAYAHGGSQSLAPVLGNDRCERLLAIVDSWYAGKSLQDAPFTGLPREGNDTVDCSSWATITELYGFTQLHKVPYINGVNGSLFLSLTNLQDTANQTQIAAVIRKEIESHPSLQKSLVEIFDKTRKNCESPRSRLRAVESNKQKKLASLYLSKDCILNFVDAAYDQEFKSLDQAYSPIQKAMAMAHLLIDADAVVKDGTKLEAIAGDDEDHDSVEDISAIKTPSRSNTSVKHPLNTILAGPPGTGKTYRAVDLAVEIIDGSSSIADISEDVRRHRSMERFKELRSNGYIEMVTFHQSYTYEDFIEGIRPDVSESSGQITYTKTPGVLKKFVEQINNQKVPTKDLGIRPDASIWRISLGDNQHFESCIKSGSIGLGYDVKDDLTDVDLNSYFAGNGLTNGRFILELFRDYAEIGDIVCVFNNSESIKAVGIITSDYKFEKSFTDKPHRRTINWMNQKVHTIIDINGGKRMMTPAFHKLPHMKISDLLQRINAPKSSSAVAKPQGNYVLIIDEINRGNLSKIFGELMTLIEPDKREGQVNALRVRLPLSGDLFVLPGNLYIIATMNTADRSLAMLDFALRRRFTFRYIEPDSNLVPQTVGDIPLRSIFESINNKIEATIGRDYKLGHSLFMGIKSLGDLKTAWFEQILPLLNEYYFDDVKRLRQIIPGFVESLTDSGTQEIRSGRDHFRLQFNETADFIDRFKKSA